MLITIESIIQRKDGTHVTLGSTDYHFAPSAQHAGAHVADVTDPAHVSRFLSITEGYRMYGAATVAASAPVVPALELAASAPAPAKSMGYPDSFTIGGVTITLAEVVALAQAADDLTVDVWLDLSDEERASKIDAQLDSLQDAADMPPPPPAVTALDTAPDADALAAQRAQLVIEHQAMFGSKPHHKWSIERIKEALAAGPNKEA